MPKIHSYSSEATFLEAVVTSVHSRILKKNHEGTIFRLALSGGSTPGPIYEALSKMTDIKWSLVEVYLVDERYVSHDDENSNHRLLKETLIDKLPQKPAKWISFDTSLTIEECLKQYEEELGEKENHFFDLVLLGMGPDGHTASLFPNDKLLKEKKRWVGHSSKGDPIPDRLTLTYPALESSAEIFFLLKGSGKKAVLQQVQESKADQAKLPAARLFHLESTQVFFAEV